MITTEELQLQTLATISMEEVCSDLSNRAFRILALVRLMGEDANRTICIKRAMLAEKLRVSVHTIARALSELVAKGYLIVKQKRHKNGVHTYERKQSHGKISSVSSDEATTQALPFPKELLERIVAIRKNTALAKDRAKEILNAIAQFLPASIIDDNEPLRFVPPPSLPVAILQKPSSTGLPIAPMASSKIQEQDASVAREQIAKLAALEIEFNEMIERGPKFGVEAYQLRLKLQAMRRKCGVAPY